MAPFCEDPSSVENGGLACAVATREKSYAAEFADLETLQTSETLHPYGRQMQAVINGAVGHGGSPWRVLLKHGLPAPS